MGNERLSRLKPISFLSVMSFALLFFYQNCSSKDGTFTSASIVSSQCTSKLAAANLVKVANANQLNCSNSANYSCDLRVFNESFKNEVTDKKTCISLAGKDFCVSGSERHYDTSGARNIANTDASEFNPGGDYNRREANCSYFDISQNMSLLQAEGEITELALADLVAQCSVAQKLKE